MIRQFIKALTLSFICLWSLFVYAESDKINLYRSGFISSTSDGLMRNIHIDGRLLLTRDSASTKVEVHVTGLEPNQQYMSHVHNLPCALGGGAHYKIDPTVEGTERENEIWPTIQTDSSGIGYGVDTVEHLARMDATSIVIHDISDGTRIACGDLEHRQNGKVFSGTFTTFNPTEINSFEGSAQMLLANDKTYVELTVSGLEANTFYPAHVHALPCEFNQGGGHYKIDPTISDTEESNEIWPYFTTDNNGTANSKVWSQHAARFDAMSIVIHKPITREKFACADLSLKTQGTLYQSGEAVTTAVGIERGLKVSGKAAMIRKKNNSTVVKLRVSGLQENTFYPTHVHNLSCALGGGGHYKIDPSIAEPIESNEIWPTFTTNATGKGRAHIHVKDHIARPEAQSIVIHDPQDSARIACFTLSDIF